MVILTFLSINIVLLILLILSYFEIHPFQNKSKENFNEHPLNVSIKIYLINMNIHKKRLISFKDEFNRTDLKTFEFEKIDAINGKEIDLNKYLQKKYLDRMLKSEKAGYREYHFELTRGGIGCYLSHLQAYKKISKQTEEFGLVFEDDVTFVNKTILDTVSKTIKNFEHWDIILLGCSCNNCIKHNNFQYVNRFFGTHAYVIKKQSAIKILKILENKTIDQQIDSELSDMCLNGQLKIYCLYNLVKQKHFKTSIQIPIKHTDKIDPFTFLSSVT